MEAEKKNKNIFIKFNSNEALVLFEWITKFNQKHHSSLFEDQAEERVLFDFEASLEKVISETFEGDYYEHLLKARQDIRDKE